MNNTTTFADAIHGKNIYKKFGAFELNIPELHIPQGLATALIGENGAGKTTLLNMLSGIRLDGRGDITYFGQYRGVESDPCVKEQIGYTGTDNYYLPHWTTKQVKELNAILFDDFDGSAFDRLAEELALDGKGGHFSPKKITELSDGNKTKLMLCGVLARKTKLLLLDEPASPLDPLMRDKLCDLIRRYLDEGAGERSVFFSTHNVADMESVTDYALILEQGRIVEEGFVEDLKEKYVLVQGNKGDLDIARRTLYSISENSFGFTGVCLAENLDKLAGCDIATELPTLTDIAVAVMKHYTRLNLAADAA